MTNLDLHYADGQYTSTFKDMEELKEAIACKKHLEGEGWKFLGWSASSVYYPEGLFITGVWMEYKAAGYVFCLSDAQPIDWPPNGICHPDPFSAPVALARPCNVTVYKRPFTPGEDGPWEMDGSAPVSVNEDNTELMAPIFRNVPEALDFVEWLLGNIKPTYTGTHSANDWVNPNSEHPPVAK